MPSGLGYRIDGNVLTDLTCYLFSLKSASVLHCRRNQPSRLPTSIRISNHKRNFRFRIIMAGGQILSLHPIFRIFIWVTWKMKEKMEENMSFWSVIYSSIRHMKSFIFSAAEQVFGHSASFLDGYERCVCLWLWSEDADFTRPVTLEFQSQTSLLKPPELAQIYMLLNAGRKANRRFFAFYNCAYTFRIYLHYQYWPCVTKVVTIAVQVSRISISSSYLSKGMTVRQ